MQRFDEIAEQKRGVRKAATVLRMTCSEVHGVAGGDHSLLVGKRHLNASGLTQDAVDQRSLQAIRRFVASCLR